VTLGTLLGLADRDGDRVELLRSVIDCMPSGVVVVDMDGALVLYNAAARNALASRFVPLEDCWDDREVFDVDGKRRLAPAELPLARALAGEVCDGMEIRVHTRANRRVVLRVNARPMLQVARNTLWAVGVFQEIGAELEAEQHRRELEAQLQRAQKMESLGQLASGIAHEINTPTQYISDNLRFLQTAFDALDGAIDGIRALLDDQAIPPTTRSAFDALAEEAELDFYAEEVPAAVTQSLEGLERVASIVAAMKAYAHPCETKEPTDLDQVVRTAAAMSKNEWKYVADLQLELDGTLPAVPCVAGEISQVVLNLIVNAAHAIGSSERGRGTITIRSTPRDDGVAVVVEDDGGGIPRHLVNRVFDPFFTTKPVGKGTGQGLALAYNVIVRKHGGRLDVDSEPGIGSRFTLFLPFLAREAPAA
jgi:signal transduction histidine kinase